MKSILTVFALLAISAAGALAADAKAGHAAYDKACKSCHGADGVPNPAIAKMTLPTGTSISHPYRYPVRERSKPFRPTS